jgi:uncharacterized membrane protein YbhN (UPF0104 family)
MQALEKIEDPPAEAPVSEAPVTEGTPTVWTRLAAIWSRYARIVGFVVLAAVTIYGLRELFTGDWNAVAGFWRARMLVLLAIVGLAALDIFLEGVAWVWVVERFGMRARDLTGARVYLAANAGRLLPAQLGRLIRPEEMVRLGRGTTAQCLKTEGTVFVLDSLSVAALLAGLLVWRINPALGVLATLGTITVALFLGSRIADALSDTKLDLPRGFWWNPKTFATAMIQLSGWVVHGLAFYVLVSQLPGSTGLWDAVFLAPASAVLGVGSGLPGGIGATEGVLGVSLSLNGVPAAHLAVAVTGFRIITFWAWVLIGWLALLSLRRQARSEKRAAVAAGSFSAIR